jgi:hydrogenase nickel incorporation protein HypA/HybF
VISDIVDAFGCGDHSGRTGANCRRSIDEGAGVHELSITESVVSSVTSRLGDQRVEAVTLEVGALSGVVPDSIRFCFDLCVEGTTLQGATLIITEIPGRGCCRTCDRIVDLPDQIPLCECGSADLEILNGEELRISSVTLAAQDERDEMTSR